MFLEDLEEDGDHFAQVIIHEIWDLETTWFFDSDLRNERHLRDQAKAYAQFIFWSNESSVRIIQISLFSQKG